MATRKLEVLITGDASSLEKSLGKTQTAATGFATKFRKVALIGGAVGAGLAAVGVGLKKTTDAALESEKAQARLESALKGAGVSMDKYGSTIQANIDKTSRLAALDDEDLSDSFAKLVRVTGDVTKATEGMNLAADIARARNISLEASTKMVERAMSGNEAAFSRIGIKLEKTATAQDVLAEAQKRFGGAAEDYGKTSAAAQERFGVAMENVQELIGAKVLPILATLAEKLLALLNWVILNWPRFQRVVEDVMDKVKIALDRIRPVLEALFKTWESIIRLVVALVKGDWSEAWTQFKNVVTNAVDYVRELLGLAWAGFKKAAVALGGAIISGIKEGLEGIGMAAWNLINNISERITEFRDKIVGWGAGIAKALVTGLLDGLTGLGSAILEKIKDAFDWVRDHMPKLPSIDVPLIGGGGSERGPRIGPGASVTAGLGSISGVGRQYGLAVTSGFRPGDPGDHGKGKALDISNTYQGDPDGTPEMDRAFLALASMAGALGIKDLLYTPGLWKYGFNIDNGRRAAFSVAGHGDHIHASVFDQGGWLAPKSKTLAINNTSSWERVGPPGAGGGGDIIIQVDGETLARVNRRYAEKHARRNG